MQNFGQQTQKITLKSSKILHFFHGYFSYVNLHGYCSCVKGLFYSFLSFYLFDLYAEWCGCFWKIDYVKKILVLYT